MKMGIDIKEAIATELKQLRFDSNMTQGDVAERSSVDISTIVRYERNNVTMQLDTLSKIVSAFGLTLYIFFVNIIAKTHDNKVERGD